VRAPKTYDAQEANRILPEVRSVVGQIVELSALLPELTDEVRIAEYRRSRPDATSDEADKAESSRSALEACQADLEAAIERLEEMGVQLKDPITGLVDFFSYREGELVELCWRLGEESVAHWHRIGEGFPGRKPL
jgi:hypothetical protein